MSSGNDSYNRGGFIAFMFSLVFSFAFIVYISFLHPGVELNEIGQEGDVAVDLAGGGSALPAGWNAADVQEPWVTSPELVAYGKQVYGINCAVCHGAEGKGDGAAGAALNPKPRNLVAGGWRQGGGPINLYNTLITGVPGGSMASFKHLPKVDRWAMVHFMQSITEDKGPNVDAAQLEGFARNAE